MEKFDAGQTEYSEGFASKDIEHARGYEDERYFSNRRGRRLNELDQAFAKMILELAGEEAHIVDVPCGTGRFFNVFSRAQKLTMIDYSENMLSIVKERHGEHDHIQVLQGDIKALPLEDRSADACFSMRYFHHLDNDKIALTILKELARVSRRYVGISFYNKNSYKYISRTLRGKGMSGFYFKFQTIRDLAEEAGLRVVKKIPKFNLKEQHCLVLFEKV
jgi:ubiquinone/menaquinone biosynthesis C-methylase UbiE